MDISEIKNRELVELLQFWNDNILGMDITYYDGCTCESDIVDEFLESIQYNLFHHGYIKEEIKEVYNYYEKLYALKQKYYS